MYTSVCDPTRLLPIVEGRMNTQEEESDDTTKCLYTVHRGHDLEVQCIDWLRTSAM
jgi:hypothetical protein